VGSGAGAGGRSRSAPGHTAHPGLGGIGGHHQYASSAKKTRVPKRSVAAAAAGSSGDKVAAVVAEPEERIMDLELHVEAGGLTVIARHVVDTHLGSRFFSKTVDGVRPCEGVGQAHCVV
jgi:hypothetical protein